MNVWLLASRPKTLIAAVAPVMAASAWAHAFNAFSWAPCLLCLLFGVLIQITTNFANDYYDFQQGVDTPERIGPTRAVAAGFVEPHQMLKATYVTSGLSVAVGLCLLAYMPGWFLLLGALSVFLAYAYTAAPFCFGYRGWGDVLIFLFFGLVAVNGSFYAQAGFWSWPVCLTGATMGLLATNIALVNNYRDADTDARAGKRTLIVRLGKRFGRIEYAFNFLFSLAACAFLGLKMRHYGLWLPALQAPHGWYLCAQLKKAHTSVAFNNLLGQTAFFMACYTALMCFGLFTL